MTHLAGEKRGLQVFHYFNRVLDDSLGGWDRHLSQHLYKSYSLWCLSKSPTSTLPQGEPETSNRSSICYAYQYPLPNQNLTLFISWPKHQPPGYFQITFEIDVGHHDLRGGIFFLPHSAGVHTKVIMQKWKEKPSDFLMGFQIPFYGFSKTKLSSHRVVKHTAVLC